MAFQAGFALYSTVKRWCVSVPVFEFVNPDKLNCAVPFPCIVNGMDSVTNIRLLKTAMMFSSPSLWFPEIATILYLSGLL